MGDIKTPGEETFMVGDNKVTLSWSNQFASKWNGNFDKAQAFVDSEVLRYDDPLMPKQTGNMINSGKRGTDIGSGLVRYTAPYSHHQYYNTAESRPYDSHRGAHWFERMKTAHLDDIRRGVKQYME